MSEIDLSTLSRRELRRLLDVSRERGQAEASYQILREMETRRKAEEARKGLFAGRRGAKPHVVALDLGDPMDRGKDDPPPPDRRPPSSDPEAKAAPPAPAPKPRRTRKPPAPAAEETPAAEAAPPAPQPREPAAPETPVAETAPAAPEPEAAGHADIAAPALQEPPPAPTGEDQAAPVAAPGPEPASEGLFAQPLRLDRREPPAARRAPRNRTGLAFAAGAALGLAAGWGVSQFTRPQPPPAAEDVAATAAAATASPPAAPAEEPAPPEETSPVAAEFQPDAPLDLAPSAPEPPAEEAKPVAAEPIDAPPPAETPATAVAVPRAEIATETKSCAAEPTPADRAICADPRLRRLQQQLQQAYAEALDAHQDRELLRQHQLAWRDGRNDVSDPDRLAQIYEARIRKLNSATQEALRQR
jgi:hypothetical protein